MSARLRRLLLFVLLAASGCNLGSTEGTVTHPPPVTPDAAVGTELAAEPTPASFDVDATEMAVPQLTATTGSDGLTADETTGEPLGTVAAGENRLTIRGETEFTFDSAGTGASAAFVDQGETALLRFSLGSDASSLFAQEIGIMIPADIEAGEYLLQGNFGLGALTGDEGDSGLPMQGRVTIGEVTASSISGAFEFTADTGGPQPTAVTGIFKQIPKVTE